MVIVNQVMAFGDFQRLVSEKFGVWYQRIDFQKGRHLFLKPSKSGFPSFYVVFKREFFVTFNDQFRDFVLENLDFSGYGESLNEEAVSRSIHLGVDYIVFVHPDNAYLVPPMQFYKFAHKFHLVRRQDRVNSSRTLGGSREGLNELTLSVPIKLLKNFNEVFP